MSKSRLTVLVVGATGSIGRLVVDEALRRGHSVHALVRNQSKAARLSAGAEVIIGDLTRPETLAAAVEGVDAIVFTHGSDGGGKLGAETNDYGGVRNILKALCSRPHHVGRRRRHGMAREDRICGIIGHALRENYARGLDMRGGDPLCRGAEPSSSTERKRHARSGK